VIFDFAASIAFAFSEPPVRPLQIEIRHNGRDFLMQPRLVAATKDKLGNKIRRACRDEMK
jgi:hypothetical protein